MGVINVSPDGIRYLAMARGEGAPIPFHLRWLLPFFLRENLQAWRVASIAGWLVFVVGTGVMGGWPAALLVAALSGPALVFRLPVLVDGVAMGFAMLVALQTNAWAAVGLAIILGCISERAPVFAALWAWSPWPLVGLISPLVRRLAKQPGPEVEMLRGTFAGDALVKPWRIGLHRNWRDISLVAPWGGLLAGFWFVDVQMAATAFVAYAQLIVATDAIRLYQWAAPLLAVTLAQHFDWRICMALVAVTWFNPLRGDGI